MIWALRPFDFLLVILACARASCGAFVRMCKEPVEYPEKMYSDLNIDPAVFDGVALYRGRGCERCKNSGYAGRLAIIEAMTVSDEIRKLVIARANTREISKVAIGQGMRTLRMVALDRARDGVSTLEQVLMLTAAHWNSFRKSRTRVAMNLPARYVIEQSSHPGPLPWPERSS